MSSSKKDYRHKAGGFLPVAPRLRLGELPTEQPHPLTENLSYLTQHDLPAAPDGWMTLMVLTLEQYRRHGYGHKPWLFGLLLFFTIYTQPGFAHVTINSNINVLIELSEKSLDYYVQIATFNLEPLKEISYGRDKTTFDRFTYKGRLEDFFSEKCPVIVDNHLVRPVVRKLDFCDTVQTHLGNRNVTMVLARISLNYPIRQKPHTVVFDWGVYVQKPHDGWGVVINPKQDPQEVLADIIAFDKPGMVVFTPSDPRYIRRETFDIGPLKREMEQVVEPWKRHVLPVPALSAICCLAILLLLLLIPFRKVSWKITAVLCISLLAVSVSCRKALIVELPFAWEMTTPPPEPKDAREMFASILNDVYHAFGSGKDGEKYMALSESVAWTMLPEIYARFIEHLIVKEGGGDAGIIRKVDIVDFQLLRFFREKRCSGIGVTATWRTTSEADHKNHFHEQVNEYSADFLLVGRNGKWVIDSLKMNDWGMLFTRSGISGKSDSAASSLNWPENYVITVSYRGEKFSVDRFQPGYNAVQGKRIGGLIVNESAPRTFKNLKEICEFGSMMEAPACGSSIGGAGDETPRGQFTYISIEVPLQKRFRTLVYLRQNNRSPYELFDDFFVEGDNPPIMSFSVEGNRTIYFQSNTGAVIRTNELP